MRARATIVRLVRRPFRTGSAGFHGRLRLFGQVNHVPIDLRTVDQLTVTAAAARGIDVVVALGWPGTPDMVKRPPAQSRLIDLRKPR